MKSAVRDRWQLHRLPLVLLLTLTTLFAAVVVPAAASAAGEEQTQEALDEFEISREKISEAVDQVKAGDREEANRTAVAAYLEHFERVEPTLRVVDSDLTLELEDRYAAFRSSIESGQPLSVIREDAASIRSGLTEFEGELENPSIAAGSIAMLSSFSIIFREGLEAVLVLMALLGFLRSADQRRYSKHAVAGVVVALLASILCFILLGVILDIAPLQRELLEATMTVIAVVLLFAISFWLLRRIEHRHWMEFVRARMWKAAAGGSALAVALVGFVAVFREGFETALFYQALLFYTTDVIGYVIAGFVLGVVALIVIGYALIKLRQKLPIKTFMGIAVGMVMLLSVAFTGNAVNQLQNLDYLPDTSLRDELPRIPVQIAQLTGIHPTVESLTAQGGLLLIYIVGGTVTIVLSRRQSFTPEDLTKRPGAASE